MYTQTYAEVLYRLTQRGFIREKLIEAITSMHKGTESLDLQVPCWAEHYMLICKSAPEKTSNDHTSQVLTLK